MTSDAKLAASTGAALGWISWQDLFTGTFAAFALAGIYGGALMALHRATRVTRLPFGPFILLGTLVAIATARGDLGVLLGGDVDEMPQTSLRAGMSDPNVKIGLTET